MWQPYFAGRRKFPSAVSLTFFTIPKPFEGHVATIQLNAIRSWTRVGDVVVFGDDLGVADAARSAGARHVPAIARNEYGTPLVADAFARVEELSDAEALCYVNADIVLFD